MARWRVNAPSGVRDATAAKRHRHYAIFRPPTRLRAAAQRAVEARSINRVVTMSLTVEGFAHDVICPSPVRRYSRYPPISECHAQTRTKKSTAAHR